MLQRIILFAISALFLSTDGMAQNPSAKTPEHLRYYFGNYSRGDQVIDGRSADEHPLPEVVSTNASNGLVALDHGA